MNPSFRAWPQEKKKSEAAVSVTGVSGGTCLDDGDTLHTLQRLGLITLARHWRAVPELSVRKPCSPQSVSLFLRPNSRLLATIPQDTWTKRRYDCNCRSN